MRCPNCHKRIDDDSEFCSYCGQKIIRERACPKCGFINDAQSAFCKKCGTKLDNNELEQHEETSEIKEKVQDIAKAPKKDYKVHLFVQSVIAMSLMLLSFFLILIALFTPFYTSTFFPDIDFTIIGYISMILGRGLDELIEEYHYVEMTYAFVMIAVIVSTVVLIGLFIGFSIPKFIKGIKKKEFVDLSRSVSIVYTVFVGIFVSFTKFVLNEQLKYSDSICKWPVFVLVIVPIIIAYNVCVYVQAKGMGELKQFLKRIIASSFSFILVMLIVSRLGGDRFFVISNTEIEPSLSAAANLGNLDFISYILSRLKFIDPSAKDYVIGAFISSGIACFLEVTVLCLSFSLIHKALSNNIKKRPHYVYGIVFASITAIIAIVTMVLNGVTNSSINKVDNVEDFQTSFQCMIINNNAIVTYLVLSLFALALYVTFAFIDPKERNGGKDETR